MVSSKYPYPALAQKGETEKGIKKRLQVVDPKPLKRED